MGIATMISDKRRYWQYKARIRRLPPNYRTAVDAIERYVLHIRPWSAQGVIAMLDDLADLFEQSAADGTPIATIVGDDPVEFAEGFLANYAESEFITRERERLVAGIARATKHEQTD